MCGIAGYFGTNIIPVERVEHCLKLMRRRGPDQAAHRQWTNRAGRNTYLLFARLSIIDLDPRANQPLNVNSRWIVFNGELYNYLERRKELSDQGFAFKTQSDTEVLLRAVDHYGWDVLDKCEGMWAFATYNETDGSLALCRDRFGEKPLYLYRDAMGIYFGSEVKFIVALLGKVLEVNHDHLYRYMINGYRALYKEGHAFFKGIAELPAATHLQIESDGKEDQRSYWQPCFTPVDGMTYEEAVKGAREKLIRSVELRLRADVPLAFCMSGGVDSNSLISIAKRVFNYDVHGFTIVNTDARYEEQEMVEHAVRELNIRHTPILVNTNSFLPKLRELVRYHDAPVYTINYYAHWLLMESIAAQGYRISVSGTAADELFSGYYDHHLAYLAEVYDDAATYRVAKEAWQVHIRPIVLNPFLSDPNLFVRNAGFRDHLYLDADDFRAYFKYEWVEPFAEHEFTDSLLRNRMMNEMFYETVPPPLHEDDLNAMYYSVENRSPFLDRDLFEFCYSIPSRHLIRDGMAKAVLRDAARGIVPDAIVDNRRKVGFNAPIFSFLDVKDTQVRSELLADSPIFDHIRREKIEQLIDKPDLPNSESKFLFYFLSSKFFLEEFS